MKLAQLVVGCTIAIICTACGTATSQPGAGVETDEPVGAPTVNWDAPVVNGVDLPVLAGDIGDAVQAQARASAPFAPVVAHPTGGKLIRAQAADPAEYPPEFRGYGLLYRFSATAGFPGDRRVLVEETAAAESDISIVEGMAANGPGFELIQVAGTPVAFIHPDENMASALFVHKGIKYNIHGPAIPAEAIPRLVAAVLRAAG